MSLRIVGLVISCMLLLAFASQWSLPNIQKLPPVERVEARFYSGENNQMPWVQFDPQLEPRPPILESAPKSLIEYRYHISLPTARQKKNAALLVTQAVNGFRIYMNGEPLEVLPLSTFEYRTAWYRPALVQLTKHFDEDSLIIYTRSWEPHLFISPIYMGDYSSLFWIHEVIHFLSVGVGYIGGFLSTILGLFFLRVWLDYRKDTLYLFAATAAISWGVVFLLVNLHWLPIQLREFWRIFVYGALASTFWGLGGFLTVYAGVIFRKSLIWLQLAIVTVGPIGYFLLRDYEPMFDRYWTLSLYLVAGPPTLYIFYRWISHTKDLISVWVGFSSLICLVFSYQGQKIFSGFVDNRTAEIHVTISDILYIPIYFINLFMPLFFVACGLLFIERYRGIHRELIDAAAQTKEKLILQAREINLLNIEKLARGKKEAADAERDIIHRDLHDGIGARLVAHLYRLREKSTTQEQLEKMIIDCLKDIKKIIDARPDQPISDFIGHFFEHCLSLEEVFSPTGIRYEYDVPHGISLSLLDDIDHHILFIFQEIISNFIKHSPATSLSVALSVGDHLVLQVTEFDYLQDGNKFRSRSEQNHVSSGRGLMNIRERAHDIQGDLYVNQGTHQRVTQLMVPLNLPTDNAQR